MEEGIHVGRMGYAKDKRNSLEHGESEGERTMEVRAFDAKK